MIFSQDEAFRQLRDEGKVYTFRTNKRESGPVWIRRSRTGPKEFDAVIAGIDWNVSPDMDELEWHYADESGFASVEAWRQAIREVHGEDITGHIYTVYCEEAYREHQRELREKYPRPTCPECGSTVRERSAKKTPGEARGFGTESDLWSWKKCEDCGWTSKKR